MSSPVWLTSICQPSAQRPEALPTQIYHDVLAAVRQGRIGDGDHLPSSRTAADALGVSRSTVTAAYELLVAEGVVAVRQGAAPRVIACKLSVSTAMEQGGVTPSQRGSALAIEHRRDALPADGGALTPGKPDECIFPVEEWSRALRRAARRRHGSDALYASLYGVLELRNALKDRIAVDRGVHVDADQIVVVPGTQAALALLAHTLTDPGDLAAIENPGYLGARAAFQAAGLRFAALDVDEHGADPSMLPREARLVYLTPSNQYPLGTRLSLSRRLEFIAKARETGATLIEDDYDSEFHWTGRTIPALAAQPHGGHVVLVGSASKVLLPALRIGWIVLPPALVDAVRSAQRNLGMVANLHAQLALAELMRSGRYRTQVRRITRAYQGRVTALVNALEKIPGAKMRRPDGGVHVAVQFEADWHEDRALGSLMQCGLRPAKLSGHCVRGEMKGLVIGAADATPKRIATLSRVLAQYH